MRYIHSGSMLTLCSEALVLPWLGTGGLSYGVLDLTVDMGCVSLLHRNLILNIHPLEL